MTQSVPLSTLRTGLCTEFSHKNPNLNFCFEAGHTIPSTKHPHLKGLCFVSATRWIKSFKSNLTVKSYFNLAPDTVDKVSSDCTTPFVLLQMNGFIDRVILFFSLFFLFFFCWIILGQAANNRQIRPRNEFLLFLSCLILQNSLIHHWIIHKDFNSWTVITCKTACLDVTTSTE